jgi:hypothetical protein
LRLFFGTKNSRFGVKNRQLIQETLFRCVYSSIIRFTGRHTHKKNNHELPSAVRFTLGSAGNNLFLSKYYLTETVIFSSPAIMAFHGMKSYPIPPPIYVCCEIGEGDSLIIFDQVSIHSLQTISCYIFLLRCGTPADTKS